MNFLEKNLECIIYGTDRDLIRSRGLYLPKRLKRQVHIGNYGVADLVGIDIFHDCVLITVFELKKETIGTATFLQIIKYCKGIKHWIKKTGKFKGKDIYFKMVLIGGRIEPDTPFLYIQDFFGDTNTLELYKYSYEFDGIFFERLGNFVLTNPGF